MFFNKTAKSASPSAPALDSCLAKTYTAVNGRKHAGRTVSSHCHIVGSVARSLIARMPIWLRENFFPPGSELIAAAHDIGKISPTFQKKIYIACDDRNPDALPGLENVDPSIENNWGGHAGTSQAEAIACQFGKYIPEILGQHHGYTPCLGARFAHQERFGGLLWQERRKELIEELKANLNCQIWPKVHDPLHAQVLSGLTTVSDWIGSGSLFNDPDQPWDESSIDSALDSAGFIKPKLIESLSFSEIFFFEPNDSQQKFIECCTKPGVYVLEAPMGLGKTEAALYAAYQVIAANRAVGIYFALPTQLTSDKIHERMNAFLEKILAKDSENRKALLLHGNAWLKSTELGEDGQPGGSWFDSRKRGILAPFGVGTIDQALMAIMNVKHGFVRTFGLAGKVIILDEVHSYDAYTGTILDHLVGALRDLDCTVIILSATLTRTRRQEMLKKEPNDNSYPLISAFPKSEYLSEISVKPMPEKHVSIKICNKTSNAIEEALLRAEQGQQVLWIENTVKKSQDKFKLLASRIRASNSHVDCGLLHSRFIKSDREKNENKWIQFLGKDSADRKKKGRILVGTQVLEQSLDIDADFLVTRICPTDMLLQRIGRLWRHKNTLRPESALREAWILSPEVHRSILENKNPFDDTGKVYSPYVLYRSLEVWNDLDSIILPTQIRPLIESTYADRVELDKHVIFHQRELEENIEKLGKLALGGVSNNGKTLPESKASTRYSEQDTVDVLLIGSYHHDNNKNGTFITLLDNQKIYLPKFLEKNDRRKLRNLAGILMQNTVKVANYLAPKATPMEHLNWLRNYLYLGQEKDDDSLLRIALVKNSGDMTSLNFGPVSPPGYQLRYDSSLGYQADKIKNNFGK